MKLGVALEPGTWADWANAVSTALAFLIALGLFLIGLRDRRRADEDRRRDRARHVWIWPGGMSGNLVYSGEIMQHTVDWMVENKSSDPIARCRIGLLSTPPAGVAVDKPSAELLRPADTIRGTLAYGQVQAEEAPPPALQVIFVDSAGLQWRRDSNGNLEEWHSARSRHR
jgi:hypothetical protein